MGIKEKSYKLILDQYNRKKHARDRLVINRQQEIYNRLPAYRDLDRQMVETSESFARRYIGSPDASGAHPGDELKSRLEELREKKRKLLVDAGYPADYLSPPFDCPLCSDTGMVDGRMCSCLSRRLSEELYEQSHIKEVLLKENFTQLTYRYYNDAEKDFISGLVSQLKRYAASFGPGSRSLLFLGNTGSGKTFLSNCLSKELLDKGFEVIYFTSYQLFDFIAKNTFGRSFDGDGEYKNLLEDIFSCDFLVIDDLGSEMANSFVSSQLFLILNERHQRKKATLISSNLDLQGINDLYSERCTSRLLGDFNLYHFSGRDMRSLMRGMM